jgi:class 3 adenylate cyclase
MPRFESDVLPDRSTRQSWGRRRMAYSSRGCLRRQPVPGKVVTPLLEAMVPDGLHFGGNYLVEFEPSSPWYETSTTIAAQSIRRGLKVEYHSFHRTVVDVARALEALGISVEREESRGTLRIIGSFASAELGKPSRQRTRSGFLSNRPPDLARWGREIRRQIDIGFQKSERGWIHIDDNTSLLLQYVDEESLLNSWRTTFIPWGRAREMLTINGFVKGVAPETFYRKAESIYDGVFDMVTTEEEGRLEHYIRARRLQGESFDSSWMAVRPGRGGEVRIGRKAPATARRHLAAVMFTDMVGYSELMRHGEGEAMRLLARQESILRSTIPKYDGKVIKGTGDGFLVEFGSALAAAECARAVQRRMHRVKGGHGIRIGLHVGDVIHQGGDIFGDAVNVAARLLSLSKPGGICISKQVQEQISGRSRAPTRYLGAPRLKNLGRTTEAFEILVDPP